jgi:hypothetical protein
MKIGPKTPKATYATMGEEHCEDIVKADEKR